MNHPGIRQQVLIIRGGAYDMGAVAHEIAAAGLGVALVEVVDALGYLGQEGAATGETGIVVLGPGVDSPLALARQIRGLRPRSHFIFAPLPAHLGDLKQALGRAPLIGSAWSLAEPGIDSLPRFVVETAHVVRRKARLRMNLDRANRVIGKPKPLEQHDYQRLVVSDHYLRNLLAQAHDAIVALDANRRVLHWSAGAERMFGLGAAAMLGQSVEQLPFWNNTLGEYLRRVSVCTEAFRAKLKILTPSGQVQVETVISGVLDESGSPVGFSLNMRDVTAQDRALEAEREARARMETLAAEKEKQRRLYESMLSSAADQSYVMDLDGRLLYANRAVSEQLEAPPQAILGKTASELGFPEATAGQIKRHIQEVVSNKEPVRAQVPFTAATGREWVFEYILAPVIDDNGQVEAVAGTSRDITEHKETSDRVWREANFDALTGLPNRRLFRDRLKQEVRHSQRSGRPLALFFVDLDRFKQVNDLYGHAAGDELLRQAAERIRACVRKSDTVARLGGDEFTVILNKLASDETHVEKVAQKILDELARPFQVDGSICYISGSVGITLYPRDAVEPAELIRNADQAMYVAKQNGRSRFSFFTRALQEAALDRLRLLSDLRHALAGEQMRLYFQPIIDLDSGRIVKAEALLRWEHPQRGLLPPNEFIALAEESGQIKSIGNWVFIEAARWSGRWSRLLGHTLQVSINKSPVQFEGPGRHMDWAAHLEDRGLPRKSISVEVTESVLLNAAPATAEKLLELQRAGIELAIDDFGSGYSSMAYLKKFDVDYLKIDQSFIQDMADSTSSRTIAESTIVMAHKLGLKVIAEGVETTDQRDWLRSAGCDYAQGFLYSRPLPPAEFETILEIRNSLPAGA